MSEEYPEENCEYHPEEMWEWDGYCWICVKCILARPYAEKQTEQYLEASYSDLSDG